MGKDHGTGWAGKSGEDWAKADADLTQWFQSSMDLVVQGAAARPGMAILDLGCGSGSLDAKLAPLCAPGGRILGVDVSETLLHMARRRAEALPVPAEYINANAGKGPLPKGGVCESLVAHFGSMFFHNPVVAFENLMGSLTPGARLTMLGWGPYTRNDWFQTLVQGVEQGAGVQIDVPAPVGVSAGPMGWADADATCAMLHKAGLRDVVAAPQEITFTHPEGMPALLRSARYIGPSSSWFEANTPSEETEAAIDQALETLFAPFVDAQGAHVTAQVILYSGQVPQAVKK